MYKNSLFIFSFLAVVSAHAQVLTREDSLHAGLVRDDKATVISGYGEAKIVADLRKGTATADLTRNVLFLGHRFNDKFSLFSEWEIEDAKVEGGDPGGEIAMEQLLLKYNINKDIYINAGLFIPRIGIINENHLPTTFNGVDRPYVETFIIPATWREIGVGIYGQTPRFQGLNWSFGIYNGLNAADFGNGMGIREGRYEGKNASAGNVAVSGALLYYFNNFRFQVSGYYGGACGLAKNDADSLGLHSGMFGTPVVLGEADAQYFSNGFSFRMLAVGINIPDASAINHAYTNNTPSSLWGAYAEAAYNFLHKADQPDKNFSVFARYETFDLNATMPENGISDGILRQQYFVSGITFSPVRGIALKADYMQRVTGNPNPVLPLNPLFGSSPFYALRNFVNVGIAYSF